MKILILISVIILFQKVVAQETPGYLGKRIVLDFSAKLNTPVFTEQFVTKYEKDKFLVKRKYVDVAVLAGFSYAVKRNLAVGASIGYSRFRADVIGVVPRIDTDTATFTDDVELLKDVPNELSGGRTPTLEGLPFNIVSFTPRIEFAGTGALLPMGLHHAIGVGVLLVNYDNSRTVAGSTQGKTATGELLPVEPTNNVQNLIDPKNKSLVALTLQYGLNMRLPLNDFMMFNFGVLYTGNFFRDAKRTNLVLDGIVKEKRDFYYAREDYVNAVRSRVQSNLISFTTGISILF